MRDWWKALLILLPLGIAAILLWFVFRALIPDPAGSLSRTIDILVDSWPFTALPDSGDWWMWLVVASVAPALYVLVRLWDARREQTRTLDSVRADRRSEPVADASLPRVGRREANAFADAILDPQSRYLRITESVEPFTRSLLVRTTFQVRADDLGRAKRVVLPLVLGGRGRLENGLAFTDAQGGRLSSLNRESTVLFLRAVVAALIAEAGPAAMASYRRGPSGTSLEDRVARLLDEGKSLDAGSAGSRAADLEFQSLVAALLSVRYASVERLYEVCRLLGELRRNHPVCVPVQVPRDKELEIIRVTVERRVIPEVVYRGEIAYEPPLQSEGASADSPNLWVRAVSRLETFLTRVLDWTRSVAGVSPSVLTHQLSNAGRAASYHLNFAGPAGYFAARFRLVDDRGLELRADAIDALEARVGSLRGQRHAHLYLRGVRSIGQAGFQCGFYERTPGSMASATAAAFATFVIALIIGVSQVQSALEHCAGAGSDACLFATAAEVGSSETLLQILLTFPIALVAMSIRRSGDVWGGVLIARTTNAAVVALTLAALWLSAFASAFTPEGLSLAWIGVLGAMLVVLVGAVTSLVQRALVHASYVRNEV